MGPRRSHHQAAGQHWPGRRVLRAGVLLTHEYDMGFDSRPPDLVVLSRTNGQVQAAVQLVNQTGIPIVPHGAGTGPQWRFVPAAFESGTRALSVEDSAPDSVLAVPLCLAPAGEITQLHDNPASHARPRRTAVSNGGAVMRSTVSCGV